MCPFRFIARGRALNWSAVLAMLIGPTLHVARPDDGKAEDGCGEEETVRLAALPARGGDGAAERDVDRSFRAALRLLAEDAPLELLRIAREQCAEKITGYRCVLVKQERLDGVLGKVQRVELRYRVEPHSVYMRWIENAGKARRAVYVRGRHANARGEEVALIEPAGCIARLFVSCARVAVNGADARAASRHTLDHVGFVGTFSSLERVHALAMSREELELDFVGMGTIDGRPTYVLSRYLPYGDRDPGVGYPNAHLVLHLDQEWLLPVGIYTYADEKARVLLGSYTMTEVEVNPEWREGAFEF